MEENLTLQKSPDKSKDTKPFWWGLFIGLLISPGVIIVSGIGILILGSILKHFLGASASLNISACSFLLIEIPLVVYFTRRETGFGALAGILAGVTIILAGVLLLVVTMCGGPF